MESKYKVPISLPKLAKNDMQIYNDKTVVLLGSRNVNICLYKIFQSYNIQVVIYTENRILRLEYKARNINVICRRNLEDLYKKKKQVIFQNAGGEQTVIKKVIQDGLSKGAELATIPSGKIIAANSGFHFFESYKNPVIYGCCNFFWRCNCKNKYSGNLRRLINSNHKNKVILCMPPKTGDSTFENTFVGLAENINSIKLPHKPRYIDKKFLSKKNAKVKIIMGIREPIAQNLSMLYHMLAASVVNENWLLGDLEFQDKNGRKKAIDDYADMCRVGVDDVNLLWSEYIKRHIYCENSSDLHSTTPYAIQHFFDEFNENVVNVYDYPFDRERGYAIIKDGNIEVLIYQLEKLNDLIPTVSDFLDVKFNNLINGNQASDKWIAESYKQSQKEIEISQEFFDKCFDEPYVKHCYSETDIKKFKDRWRAHIK